MHVNHASKIKDYQFRYFFMKTQFFSAVLREELLNLSFPLYQMRRLQKNRRAAIKQFRSMAASKNSLGFLFRTALLVVTRTKATIQNKQVRYSSLTFAKKSLTSRNFATSLRLLIYVQALQLQWSSSSNILFQKTKFISSFMSHSLLLFSHSGSESRF